jgi:acyl-CoA synthetase (AMP-forming)/AMP-acid ligase II/acyl carrier protein
MYLSHVHALSIIELLKAHAELSPDADAIAAPGRAALSYGRLFEQVAGSVEALNRMGIGRGDRVGIVMPNGPEMAVTFLSVACAATCAPLNPSYGVDELDFYLSDLNASALVIQAGLDSPARAVACARGIPVIELTPQMGAEAGTFTLSGAGHLSPSDTGVAPPDDIALVLHTSGTTSRPKIVPLSHRNLLASAFSIKHALSLAADDCCLNVMPLFHIHGLVGATLASLAAGASVVCTPGFFATDFFRWLAKFRPTWYTAVPTIHQAILARAAANREIAESSRLRFIRSSSSALPPRVMAELEAVFGVPVVEAYGMTEASHQMTINPLPPRGRKPGSVGVAAGVELGIMGAAGELLPEGATGEIVIRGPGVMRGYENDPAANGDAFTGGWFRTGDEGSLDSEGYLFISGRLKEIINRGGEKISPREVDEALLEHPAVAQAVAFAAPHAELGEEVAAAVVLREKGSCGEAELRSFAARRLAYFKVPRRVLILDEIPKGATGKLQRVGLAAKLGLTSAAEPVVPRPAFVPARTPLEELVTAVWAEVLGVQRIGVEDNFFDLGGDSMLATRIVARLQDAARVELPLTSFFETPTPSGIAAGLENLLAGESGVAAAG